MPTDWRDEQAYAHFDDLGISGLAWECLRRNSHYRADYDRMQKGGGAPADWGLRFPRRPTAQCARRADLLASSGCARRGSYYRCVA
ncbi:MAG: transcriptional regulator domain-containing protein [Pseudomonadota bacterium]